MRATGEYATIGDREYHVVARGDAGDGHWYVGLLLEPKDDGQRFDDVVTRPNDRMARVAPSELDRYVRVTTLGHVDGAEVTVLGTENPVPCEFVGDPAWADRHGFTGSPFEHWFGSVERQAITDVEEVEVDLLAYALERSRR